MQSGCSYPIPYTGETQNETQSYRGRCTRLTLTASAASAEEVRVYNWSDYIDENLLSKFEAETGLKLIYDVFDSNEVLETKMLAGGSGYDVVVPSGTFLQRQISCRRLPEAGYVKTVKPRQYVGCGHSAHRAI